MLRSRIIPCLLIRNGGLVKGVKFDDYKYVGDPLNAVKIFNEKEVDELVIYNIDASINNLDPDLGFLERLAMQSRMPLCYGGGIKNPEQAAKVISLGFEKISFNTEIHSQPDLIRETANLIGSQSVVVTLDVRKNKFGNSYTLYSHCGSKKTPSDLIDVVKKIESEGAGEIVINSIDRDGCMGGYDLALAKKIRSAVSLPLTFIGGAGGMSHMSDLIQAVGTTGAAAGSVFVFKGKFKAVLISYERPELP